MSPSLLWVPPSVSGVPESQERGEHRAIVTVTGALPCSVFSFTRQRLVLKLGNRGIAWHVAVLVTHWESWGVLCLLDSGCPGSNETVCHREEGVGAHSPGQTPTCHRSRQQQWPHIGALLLVPPCDSVSIHEQL